MLDLVSHKVKAETTPNLTSGAARGNPYGTRSVPGCMATRFPKSVDSGSDDSREGGR